MSTVTYFETKLGAFNKEFWAEFDEAICKGLSGWLPLSSKFRVSTSNSLNSYRIA